MAAVLADTHAAIWFLARSPELSAPAHAAMAGAAAAGDPIFVSAISLVELRYLVERGRLPDTAYQALDEALSDPAIALRVVPVDQGVARAIELVPRALVPDMPDRIIAASALKLGVPLLTRDSKLRSAPVPTIW